MRALRVLCVALALALAGASAPYTSFYGFTSQSADRQRAAEDAFLDIESSAGALDTAGTLSATPHPAGSQADHQLALALRDQLQSFGFATTIEPFTAAVDTYKSESLTLYPTGRTPAASNPASAFHGLFSRRRPKPSPTPEPDAFSSFPTPTPAPVPPVTFNLREPPIDSDPDTANPAISTPFLAGSADGDVAGPLTYVGHGSDADYAALAAHGVDVRGAIALVRNSREFRGITARRAQARGVAGLLFYDDPAEDGPGRGPAYPAGPFRPATSVRRGTVGEGVTIPVLPISAANAQTLLAVLHGPSAAPPWSGAFPVGYPFARGPATVRLSVHLNRKQTTMWNVIGVLAGTQPEQSVVLAAQRDAWVFGVGDNGSGLATLVEAARGIGYAAKGGWQPQRSIVVAAWDGEEYGAYGSMAYVQRHGDDLRRQVVAYLDAQQSVTGPHFGADTVPAIAATVVDAQRVVPDPSRPGGTVYDRWALRSRRMPPLLENTVEADRSFLFGIGIPSANVAFNGPFGVDHSAYDTLTFAKTFSDPGFDLHRAAAQLCGVIVMRLAAADVIPYHFTAYVPVLQQAVAELRAAAQAAHLHFDGRSLDGAIARYGTAALRFDVATAHTATAADGPATLEAVHFLDVAAYGSAGYARATIPDVAQAIARGDQIDLDRALARTRSAIDRAADLLVP